MSRMHQLADNVWILRYPLGFLGRRFGRTVTIIRLTSGRLLIHSTAPFTKDDVAEICAAGEPAWLVDATNFHDTFANRRREAFPQVPYLVPEGFKPHGATAKSTILPPPAEWAGQVEVIRLEGMPKLNEHLFLHRASRTLIVCDLVFNFAGASRWTRWFARHVMRLRNYVGMSGFFQLLIRDRAALQASLRQMLEWDFDRVIVGHGDVIERDGKRVVRQLLRERKFDV